MLQSREPRHDPDPTKRGYLHVLATGRQKKEIAKLKLHTAISATPVVGNGVFHVATVTGLYAIKCGAAAG